MKQVILKSIDDSISFAQEFAATLRQGDIIALSGELGAGKTFLVQEICKALGITEYVNSPSYVLMNIYQGLFPIYHLDLYRLQAEEEVLELGVDELFDTGITFIEWPEIAERILPPQTTWISIRVSEDERVLEIK